MTTEGRNVFILVNQTVSTTSFSNTSSIQPRPFSKSGTVAVHIPGRCVITRSGFSLCRFTRKRATQSHRTRPGRSNRGKRDIKSKEVQLRAAVVSRSIVINSYVSDDPNHFRLPSTKYSSGWNLDSHQFSQRKSSWRIVPKAPSSP
ncbi:hypothetical protein FRC03_001663 [Tulasnella sp. 419]|nr:hypothetical protein FRC03_001663 [Tulasnella sp. 419]